MSIQLTHALEAAIARHERLKKEGDAVLARLNEVEELNIFLLEQTANSMSAMVMSPSVGTLRMASYWNHWTRKAEKLCDEELSALREVAAKVTSNTALIQNLRQKLEY